MAEIVQDFPFFLCAPILWLQPLCLEISLSQAAGAVQAPVWQQAWGDLQQQLSPLWRASPRETLARPISATCFEALRGSGHGEVASAFHGPLGFAELSGSGEASSEGPLEKKVVGEQHGLRCCWRVSVYFWAASQEKCLSSHQSVDLGGIGALN